LNEGEDSADGSKPVRRLSRIVLNGRNSVYSRGSFLASLNSTSDNTNGELDSENNKIASQSLVNLNTNNRRRLSLVSKSISGSLQIKTLDNNTLLQNNNNFTIDEENVNLKPPMAEIEQQKQNLKSKSNLSAKKQEPSTPMSSVTKSKSTTNIKNSTPKQTPRLLKLRQSRLDTPVKQFTNFVNRKSLNGVEIKE
jgi:hypothetical protein